MCDPENCTHSDPENWKRLRLKKGLQHFLCTSCGFKWKVPCRAMLERAGIHPDVIESGILHAPGAVGRDLLLASVFYNSDEQQSLPDFSGATGPLQRAKTMDVELFQSYDSTLSLQLQTEAMSGNRFSEESRAGLAAFPRAMTTDTQLLQSVFPPAGSPMGSYTGKKVSAEFQRATSFDDDMLQHGVSKGTEVPSQKSRAAESHSSPLLDLPGLLDSWRTLHYPESSLECEFQLQQPDTPRYATTIVYTEDPEPKILLAQFRHQRSDPSVSEVAASFGLFSDFEGRLDANQDWTTIDTARRRLRELTRGIALPALTMSAAYHDFEFFPPPWHSEQGCGTETVRTYFLQATGSDPQQILERFGIHSQVLHQSQNVDQCLSPDAFDDSGSLRASWAEAIQLKWWTPKELLQVIAAEGIGYRPYVLDSIHNRCKRKLLRMMLPDVSVSSVPHSLTLQLPDGLLRKWSVLLNDWRLLFSNSSEAGAQLRLKHADLGNASQWGEFFHELACWALSST
eukprot:NODE_240_length_2620_cov_44.536756_g218_i0.p1 GENE.NODE_240_length_2620_cov_44.536756_g218_i0~~NODE_240_length_2620_cov_44.536756_g218_i0.p1  ORF type:complete len:512 (+),score=73.03 NODE_240_length_2620_cov_44.536756_g218_i0:769-2304(+)